MVFIKLLLIVIVLVGIAIAGLATTILLKKNGQFPNTHVGSNPNMRKKGLMCIKSWDAKQQAQAKEELKFKKLRILTK